MQPILRETLSVGTHQLVKRLTLLSAVGGANMIHVGLIAISPETISVGTALTVSSIAVFGASRSDVGVLFDRPVDLAASFQNRCIKFR